MNIRFFLFILLSTVTGYSQSSDRPTSSSPPRNQSVSEYSIRASINHAESTLIIGWRKRLSELEDNESDMVSLAYAEFLRENFELLVDIEEKRLLLDMIISHQEEINRSRDDPLRDYRREMETLVQSEPDTMKRIRLQAERNAGEVLIGAEELSIPNPEI